MKIVTSRFGTVEISESEIYAFPEGILGFPGIHRYVLIPHPGGGIWQWLQAVEAPELAFLVCPPQAFKPDYRVGVRSEDLEGIELTDLGQGMVLCILAVHRDLKKMTANLKGPLIFNPERRLAKQQVLEEYEVRYPIA